MNEKRVRCQWETNGMYNRNESKAVWRLDELCTILARIAAVERWSIAMDQPSIEV